MTFAEGQSRQPPSNPGSGSSPGGEKKLIIDEDWKSQVEAEKAAAEAARSAKGTAQPAPEAQEARPSRGPIPLPPADLSTLVGMLATQAMVTLGALPNPMTGKVETSLAEARHFIDLIDVLEQKTRGNVSPPEAQMFENLLHELRIAYVDAEGRQPR